MSAAISAVTAALSQNGSAGIEYLSDNKTVAVVGGLGAVTAITYYLKKRSSAYNRTPSSFQLGTGNVGRKEVDDTVSLIQNPKLFERYFLSRTIAASIHFNETPL
jgi:hypothetical protein